MYTLPRKYTGTPPEMRAIKLYYAVMTLTSSPHCATSDKISLISKSEWLFQEEKNQPENATGPLVNLSAAIHTGQEH